MSASLPAVPKPDLEVHVEPDREWVVVRPQGELDLLTLPEIEETIRGLLDSGFNALRLDLSQLTFIDTGGLHLVDSLARRHAAGDLRLQVLQGPAPVRRAFEIVGMLETVPFVPARRLRVAR